MVHYIQVTIVGYRHIMGEDITVKTAEKCIIIMGKNLIPTGDIIIQKVVKYYLLPTEYIIRSGNIDTTPIIC